MHEAGVEFRNLTAFKNALFDSEELEENHLVPLSEWKELVKYHLHSTFDTVEADILKEVQQGDMINMMKFCDITDLFFYLPMQKVINKNNSADVYFILSSNTYGGHTSNDVKD